MRWILILGGALLLVYIFLDSNSPTPTREQVIQTDAPETAQAPVEVPVKESVIEETSPVLKVAEVSKKTTEKSQPPILRYHIDDGIAVVLGDIAVGAPIDSNTPMSGQSELPFIKLWESPVIPFFIGPNVSNSEQVKLALEMFHASTALRFTEYDGETDALVFTKTDGISKSYIGKIGGLQPIWIAPDSDSLTIAHEIMHALGFIHEQNRSDRDKYIKVHLDNVEDEFKHNFEVLPGEFMKLSGLSTFDFESVMIYPPWMFAKGGQSTMEPKLRDKQIHPSSRLSDFDIQRINNIYGQKK